MRQSRDSAVCPGTSGRSADTGALVKPERDGDRHMTTYPVHIDQSGEVCIGFGGFSNELFSADDFDREEKEVLKPYVK